MGVNRQDDSPRLETLGACMQRHLDARFPRRREYGSYTLESFWRRKFREFSKLQNEYDYTLPTPDGQTAI